MAKHKVKKVKDRKNSVNRKIGSKIGSYVIGGLIIFLMVASIAGVSVYNKKDQGGLSFGKYTFTIKGDKLAYTTLGGKEMGFRFLPQQTYEVDYDSNIGSLLRNAQYLGITFNPNVKDQQSLQVIELARFELSTSLPKVFSAVTEPNDLYANLPVASCDNATQQVPFIYFTEPDLNSNKSSISLENNCIIIKGNYRGILIAKDKLVYEYYDVFNQTGE